MRVSAAQCDGPLYRAYDHALGGFRRDLVWADDETARLGVGHAAGGREFVLRVEQRKRVLIIAALRWISIDLPEEKVSAAGLERVPELVEVRK